MPRQSVMPPKLLKTLDHAQLRVRCPLDNGHITTIPLRAAGHLERLPNELLDLVLLSVDIPSLTVFRRASRRAMQMVDSLHQYAAIIKHCPDVIRAIVSLQAAGFDCMHLHETLLASECAVCGDFGNNLYLINCRRLCNYCYRHHPDYRPVSTQSGPMHGHLAIGGASDGATLEWTWQRTRPYQDLDERRELGRCQRKLADLQRSLQQNPAQDIVRQSRQDMHYIQEQYSRAESPLREQLQHHRDQQEHYQRELCDHRYRVEKSQAYRDLFVREDQRCEDQIRHYRLEDKRVRQKLQDMVLANQERIRQMSRQLSGIRRKVTACSWFEHRLERLCRMMSDRQAPTPSILGLPTSARPSSGSSFTERRIRLYHRPAVPPEALAERDIFYPTESRYMAIISAPVLHPSARLADWGKTCIGDIYVPPEDREATEAGPEEPAPQT